MSNLISNYYTVQYNRFLALRFLLRPINSSKIKFNQKTSMIVNSMQILFLDKQEAFSIFLESSQTAFNDTYYKKSNL